MGEVSDAQLFVATSHMMPDYGMGSGLKLYLQDKSVGDSEAFKNVADNFVATLNACPEIEAPLSQLVRRIIWI